MTIFKSISNSQSLLQDINQTDNNSEISRIVASLSIELDKINAFALKLTKGKAVSELSINKPEKESGCYIFADQKGFFCPSCYDNQGNKVATARINKKLRVCPACRMSIK